MTAFEQEIYAIRKAKEFQSPKKFKVKQKKGKK